MRLRFYTDGGCRKGVGSWAWALVQGREITHHKSGLVLNTTNNRMELMAIIQVFAYLMRHAPNANVSIWTDSQYARRSITRDMGPLAANQDLIVQAKQLAARHNVTYRWIRGHSGDEYNDFVDELCTKTIRRMLNT